MITCPTCRTTIAPNGGRSNEDASRSHTPNQTHLRRNPSACASFKGFFNLDEPLLRELKCSSLHPTSPRHPGMRRNLVICIDGTSNQFGGKNTNVIELYHLLAKDEDQLTYYDSGIGTYAQPSWKSISYLKQVVENWVDLAIAWNLERIIIDMYGWLARTFREGDVVYLFGFSRGAYQVRALSAMIEKVGLIHRGNEAQIPFAYELYADPHSSDPIPTEQGQPSSSRAKRFKETFSRSIRVHFVGAWDTVSSVGIIRSKTLPMTTEGMTHVCHFRHALALDERRVKFLPEYAYGGVTKKPEDANTSSQTQSSDTLFQGENNQSNDKPETRADEGDVKEVWFAGTHSDIGGGNTTNENLDRSGPPLSWMMSEAMDCGLRVNERVETSKRWKWENREGLHESLTWIWWIFEYMPVKRLTYRGKDLTTQWFHLGEGRKVLPGQLIHGSLNLQEESEQFIPQWSLLFLSLWFTSGCLSLLPFHFPLLFRLLFILFCSAYIFSHQPLVNKPYVPKASAWGPNQEPLEWMQLIEDRKNWLEKDLLGTALILADNIRDRIEQSHTDGGPDTTSVDTLMQFINSPGGKWTLGRATGIASFIEKIIVHISKNKEFQDKRDQLVEVFLDANGRVSSREMFDLLLPTALNEHSDQRAQAHKALIGYSNKTKLSWHELKSPNEDTLTPIEIGMLCDSGDLALAYTNALVCSVTFTPDGKHIVSGSVDKTVRIWDATTGRCIKQLSGHTHLIHSVAVSPDGKLIASSSWDDTIRIWDLETGASVGEPWKGHTDYVRSVAFSPDGKRIVSGSSDNIVRIWDAATGRCIKQLPGHTNWVWSVAVSPDGKLIASGSLDNTIRIWDLQTGASVGEPWKGHTGSVRSVAFSPDGQYIVSGSDDGTIRRWQLSALGINTSTPRS